MKKRIIETAICLMILSALIIILPGCSPASPVQPTEKGNEYEINLYGGEIKIAQFQSNTLGAGNPMLYVDKSLLADIALKRLDEIGKKYNCTITINYYDKDEGGPGRLVAAAMINQPECDIVLSENADVSTALTEAGALCPILDFNDIIGYGPSTYGLYGQPHLLESGMYKGVMYFVSPYSHPNRQLRSGQFFCVNTELFSRYTGGVDIREINEQNQWTWSKFEEIIEQTTQTENGKTILYAASISKGAIASYSMYANGCTLLRKTQDGEYIPNYDTENTRQALDWSRKITDEYSYCFNYENRAGMLNSFENQKSVMIFLTTEYIKNKVAFLSHPFAVVPFPLGPLGNAETNSTEASMSGLAIFKAGETPEAAAYIIRDYCQPFEEYPTIQDCIEYYTDTFWDIRDINIMLKGEKAATFNYHTDNGCILSTVFSDTTKTSQEIIDSCKDILNTCLEELIIPNWKLIDRINQQ